MQRQREPSGDTSKKLKIRRIDLLPTGTGPDDGKLFISSDRESSFKRSYCNRNVFNGRRVDLADFGDPGIAAMIEAIGWTPIICMDHPIYPRLVRLFYCNMEFDRDRPSITSLVNGTPIHLTCDSLGAMLGVLSNGVRYYKSKLKNGNQRNDDWNILDALRLVRGDDKISTCLRPHLRSLPAQNRLLHNMVMSMFVQRGGNRDKVSRMDLFVLEKILRGKKADLPYMIIHHMIDSMSKKYLPYGMLLTKIFIACNVDIAEDEFHETLKGKEVYNSKTILRMGYVSTGASWKLEARGDLDEEADGDEEEEEEEGEEEGKEKEKEKQPNIVMDEVHGDLSSNGPKSSISGGADNVYESLNKLSARVDTLALLLEDLRCQQEQGLANLSAKLDVLMDFLNRHFWPYPPPPSPFAG